MTERCAKRKSGRHYWRVIEGVERCHFCNMVRPVAVQTVKAPAREGFRAR